MERIMHASRILGALFLALAALLLPAAPAAAGEAGAFNAQYAEARKHMDASRFDDAIRIYTAIIAADARQHSAYNWRSIAYTRKGQRALSLQDALKAVELEPKNPTYRFNLGYDYYYARRYDEALAEFDHSEKLGNRIGALFSYRAASRLAKGMNDEAIADATEAISRNAKDAFAHGVRARAFYRTGRHKEAVEDYARYLAVHGADNLAWAEQGYAYHQLGMQEEALRNARRLTELEPRLTVNFSGDQALVIYDRETRRARMKEHVTAAARAESEGNWEEAFAQYSAGHFWMMRYTSADAAYADRISKGLMDAYLQLAKKPELPESARRYVVQARTYVKDKRFADALKALDAALSFAPWHPALHFDRGLVGSELRNYELAIFSMQQYLRLSPQAPDARQVQDRIYEWEARMK